MTWSSFVLNLINQIPAAFWGVVVGSFFSIAGVALTNRATDKRLLAQFEYEQMQKTRDREMALRKEVYLAAAEAMAAGTNVIGQIANLDLPNDKVTVDYLAKAPAIAKVHIIAKTKTIEALSSFTGELTATIFKLFAKRFELLIEKGEIAVLDNQANESLKIQQRYLEMLIQHNIDGETDVHRRQTLQENFEFEQKRGSEAIAQRYELSKSFYVKQLEFMRECVADSVRVGRLGIPVLSTVREELELPFDEESYRQVFEDGLAKQERTIDEFVLRFRSVIYRESALNPATPP